MANYVLIAQITTSVSVSSVTFSNIPQTGYTDLKLVCSTRSNVAQAYEIVRLNFNGLTTNQASRWIEGNGSSVASSTSTRIDNFGTGNSATSSIYGNTEFYIPNYTSSNAKSVNGFGVGENNSTTALCGLFSGIWSSTAAITSIEVDPQDGSAWLSGSTFYLYGIAAVGATPLVYPKATGGDIITNDGTYWYHAFLASGTFTPAQALSCQTLVIAGGGAGGTNYGAGGGGGAGGLVYTTTSISTAQTVTIGAGATTQGALDTPSVSGNGSNSSIGSLVVATGGGGGASYNATPGSGGSGGGAGGADSSTTGGSASPSGQGFAGGNASVFQYSAAGGGGAGAIGGSPSSGPTGGNGGAGLNTYSTWATATGTGASGYYAGGGGGGAGGPSGPFSGTAGSGGAGGGGAGASGSSNGTNGTVNTGGGGGGIRQGTVSGKGGSGIVIVRYTIA